ncbi:MAG: NAD(P)H-dependent oxidoreductase [Burkholderiaceae bacterium]
MSPTAGGEPGRLRVLVILGHPRGSSSLCGALANALAAGARQSGCRVRLVDLSRLHFARDVTMASPADQPLGADLGDLRAAIEDSDHLVFVYPTWWGTYPALLKSCLDRLLTPGWAFSSTESGTGFAGHLGPRTAELVTTMDTPGPVYSLVYRAPGRQAMTRATLGFCGIDVTAHTRFGPVDHSDPARRSDWLGRARMLGMRLREGPRTPVQRARRRIAAWIGALRLQFYPMTFLAYWLGAVLATGSGHGIDAQRFWIGYGLMFALEAATVFTNELGDRETDKANARWGPFNGGSRVLHNGALEAADLVRGTRVAMVVAMSCAIVLLRSAPQAVVLGPFMVVLAVLALGYTVAPLRLSYRSLGELDVAVTHGVLAILAGHLIQGGALGDPLPWLIALPLAISILPSITLSGLPDATADRLVGKRTLAVRFGLRSALRLAGVAAPIAVLAMVAIEISLPRSPYGAVVALLAALHGGLICAACLRLAARPVRGGRIDGLMVLTLSFIMWFCVAPLARLA